MMATEYTILHTVRLTGRITTNSNNETVLELVTMRDNTEAVDALDIRADAERLPVRVECYDFEDPATNIHWKFLEFEVWRRGDGDYAWTEFSSFSDGDNFTEITVKAQSQDPAAHEEPKRVYIKIKPVIDGPDGS